MFLFFLSYSRFQIYIFSLPLRYKKYIYKKKKKKFPTFFFPSQIFLHLTSFSFFRLFFLSSLSVFSLTPSSLPSLLQRSTPSFLPQLATRGHRYIRHRESEAVLLIFTKHQQQQDHPHSYDAQTTFILFYSDSYYYYYCYCCYYLSYLVSPFLLSYT